MKARCSSCGQVDEIRDRCPSCGALYCLPCCVELKGDDFGGIAEPQCPYCLSDLKPVEEASGE